MQRYERHFSLTNVGFNGQLKLRNAKVLVVGAGGLGSPALLYLAAAGVGRIGVADGDTVDLTNLQRQIVHFTEDIGKRKTHSAAEKIRAINRKYAHPRLATGKTTSAALLALRLYLIFIVGVLFYKFFSLIR